MTRPQFRVKKVEVSAPYRLLITFGDDVKMIVDLEEVIDRFPALAPLKDQSLFCLAHIDEWGLNVVWNDQIDLAGDNLRAEATEQGGGISHERIWNWMDRNRLTLDDAASALGISRRMVAYYRNGEKPIPKHVWLACLGWEYCARQEKLKMAA